MSRMASLLGGVLCLGLAGASGYWSIRPTPPPPVVVEPGLVIEPATKQFGEVSSSDVL